MEQEDHQQETAGALNKQAFIYKKNPTSATKAITRKLRPTAFDGSYVDPNASAHQEDARTSQNEADTIATQG